MNWSIWCKAMAVVTLLASPIWFLALLSHTAGNPTAINALVGIPMGLWIGGGFFAALGLFAPRPLR